MQAHVRARMDTCMAHVHACTRVYTMTRTHAILARHRYLENADAYKAHACGAHALDAYACGSGHARALGHTCTQAHAHACLPDSRPACAHAHMHADNDLDTVAGQRVHLANGTWMQRHMANTCIQ